MSIMLINGNDHFKKPRVGLQLYTETVKYIHVYVTCRFLHLDSWNFFINWTWYSNYILNSNLKDYVHFPSLWLLFLDSDCKSLETDGRSLYNQLMKRQLPESQSSLTARARKIEPFVISRLSNKQQAKLQGI